VLESLESALSHVSVRLATFVIAMLPISELRGAIPFAIGVGGLKWQEAYLWAVAGNFAPVLPLLWGIGPLSDRLRRFRLFDRFFGWLFARTRRKGRLVERFEALGLVLFVAVPLPVTGAWTGVVAAWLFGVPKRLAVPAIFMGICIAGAIVTLASLGVIHLWSLEGP
jgi:uncharacterized membrane protein